MKYENVLHYTMEYLVSKWGQCPHLREEDVAVIFAFATRRIETALERAEDEADANGRARLERTRVELVMREIDRIVATKNDVWSRGEAVEAMVELAGEILE